MADLRKGRFITEGRTTNAYTHGGSRDAGTSLGERLHSVAAGNVERARPPTRQACKALLSSFELSRQAETRRLAEQFDAALSRVHTFTPAGATATLRTAGGVTSNMTQTTPGVFTTVLGIGGTNFNVVADTSKSPKTLDVTRTEAWLPLERRRAVAALGDLLSEGEPPDSSSARAKEKRLWQEIGLSENCRCPMATMP